MIDLDIYGHPVKYDLPKLEQHSGTVTYAEADGFVDGRWWRFSLTCLLQRGQYTFEIFDPGAHVLFSRTGTGDFSVDTPLAFDPEGVVCESIREQITKLLQEYLKPSLSAHECVLYQVL